MAYISFLEHIACFEGMLDQEINGIDDANDNSDKQIGGEDGDHGYDKRVKIVHALACKSQKPSLVLRGCSLFGAG